jgi:DNA processing protein
MASRPERLFAALTAFERYRTPSRIAEAIRTQDPGAMSPGQQETEILSAQVEQLLSRRVDVTFLGDENYPARLSELPKPPPILFTWGNRDLLHARGVGMCGSRHASQRGIEAARLCGLEVARHNLAVISGYAKGVDTETHLSALVSGGRTVIVLAEGMFGFRRKQVFSQVEFTEDRVLVISQFAPHQHWNVGAAMTRNGIIAGLGSALVVIEAGETGGTVNAGIQAIEMHRPVLALQFTSQDTPAGNELLFRKGAVPIGSPQHLGRVLSAIEAAPGPTPIRADQLHLL